MRLIMPVTVDDAVLVSSNVPEEDAWDVMETYAQGDIARVTSSLYRSVQNGNTGHDPASDADAEWWIRIGPSNRWRMFDEAVGTQTTNPDSIEVELAPSGFVDSFALLNLSAATAQVTFRIGEEDPYFDETYLLIDNSAVVDWWTWLFEPIKRQTDLAVTGLPPYFGPTVEVTLSAPDATAACGALIIGQSKQIGSTALGARLGIDDFSRKETDPDFGVTTLLKRGFRRRGDYTVLIENGALDGIYATLSELRATPLIWIPSDAYGATLIYGWYREAQTEIAYPNHSLVSLSLEGLT